MSENTPSVITLHNLLDSDSRKFTSAEILLKRILPDWINKTSSIKLKTILQKYFEFVQQHIEKLEDFFAEENINSLVINNRIMKAFVEETEERLMQCKDAEVKDACLLSSIQAINHYKISSYGTAAAFAKALEMEKQAGVFHEIEINEKQIDDRLSQLAEYEINRKAKAPISIYR